MFCKKKLMMHLLGGGDSLHKRSPMESATEETEFIVNDLYSINRRFGHVATYVRRIFI